MSYVHTHPYEQAADGHYCAAPDPTTKADLCTRGEDHPVHAMGRPGIGALARALAARQWRPEPYALARESEHRRHNYSTDCALCTNDVHAIAAAVLEILADAR